MRRIQFGEAAIMFAKQILHQLFSLASDVPFTVVYWDGTSEEYGQGLSRFTVRIQNQRFIDNLGDDYEIAFADAYVTGQVDIEGDIGDIITLAAEVLQRLEESPTHALWKTFGRIAPHMGRRSLKKQRSDVQRHYDLGNDFYRLWLDESMTYSCAYFRHRDDSLETAQLQKTDHCLRKLRIRPGESLLDIGSGWGALTRRAADKYAANAVGITLSKEQYSYSCDALHQADLQDVCDVRMQDYLSTARQGVRFDKIVSVGMIEHVGHAHLGEFSEAVASLLKPGGLALLHFITSPREGPLCSWMDRYIFPGAYLPTLPEAIQQFHLQNLRILDVENLREHYQITLDRWSERFEAHSDEVRKKLGDQFVRMWRLYLRGCSASFREGIVELHQVLVSNGKSDNVPLTREDIYKPVD